MRKVGYVAIALFAVVAVASVKAATTGRVIIIQSNSAGDRVSLIDPTPDSKFVVAGSIGGAEATVIDTQLERPIWTIHFNDGEGVRVFCFDWNADGSTKRMFVQLSNVHGFAIVDWNKRAEVGRIMLPNIPESERNKDGIQGAPAHGILV